jgi:CPA2 family monovalent cation:H+ antiporter-2
LSLVEDKNTLVEVDKKNHILILGFGRVGQTIARFLRPLNIDYVILKTNDIRIKQAAIAGEPFYYGDNYRLDSLKAAGAADARIIVVIFDNADLAAKIVENVHNIKPDTPVLVRTRDDSPLGHADCQGCQRGHTGNPRSQPHPHVAYPADA